MQYNLQVQTHYPSIEKHKEISNALSLKEWKDIINTIPDMITIHDNKFNIVYANPTARKILNLPSFHGQKVKCYQYYHGSECPPEDCPSCQSLKNGTTAAVEIFEPHLNRYIEIRSIPRRDGAGRISGLVHIVRDVTEKKRNEMQLKDYSEKLRSLTSHLQYIREAERKHIAREIHDELAQALTILKMDVSFIQKNITEGKRVDKKIRSMSKSIDSTICTVQKLISELRPGLLDNLGLKAAMQWQAEEFEEHTGIKCKVSVSTEYIKELNQQAATYLFRIFQEALTNVARHAGATEVQISMYSNSDNLVMTIRDNGNGITQKQIKSPISHGLTGMKERAHSLGGTLSIRGERNKGSVITVSLPMKVLEQ